ncbi:potassium channel family protein [[Clostridium] polysaccharolyticum]|uniref:Ion channel n=1 Tax=[Clostridium] polysaccharolyticum TaxID=29364 RepID=A0A1H9Y459_9FIRM|nr:potassium channel family protein [[Clostridium] polysaccharolyticum]SES63544.1 Ion channel [[Clostridium] polysaccharolyticum]
MNRVVVYSITLIGLLLFSNSIENKRFPIDKLFNAVGMSYQKLMRSTNPSGRVLVKGSLCFFVGLTAVFSYERSLEILDKAPQYKICLMSCILFTMALSALYFLFGIPLFIFSKIEILIQTVKRKNLSLRFLATTFILFVYAFFLVYWKETMVACGKVVLVGLIVSYMLNMSMLIHISMEPVNCHLCRCQRKQKIEEKYPLKIVLAGALILILLIVFNLFLGVVMIASLYPDAYQNLAPAQGLTYLDLLYYTVISFTTIGYGEIVPQRLESKAMAIIIAYTSVMCLVIFVSSILALKDKLSQ